MGLGHWNGKRHQPITPFEGSWAHQQASNRGASAAARGIPYDQNPFQRGTDQHLAWSQAHNGFRANIALKETT
ncbi:MAG: hypothetical protein J0H31_06340 [Alphaproteobacteria bacterium]|nr:hypothetical protein [Alphaproteobacteria bacterium]